MKKKGIYCLILFLLIIPIIWAIPQLSFVQQAPADISTTNLYDSVLNITYNLTDVAGLNASSIKIYYKTNSPDSDCYIYINGTSICGYQQTSYSSNSSDLYSFNLYGRDVYPGIYNYNETIMINTTHQSYLLDSNTSYLKIRLFNVSNTNAYSVFELFANASSTSEPLRIYYCNSSFTYRNPLTSPNCINFYNLDAGIPFNHTHPPQSAHHLIPFAVNTTTGKIGDVYVTPTSYFLLRGRDDSDWRAYYIPNISRQDTIQNMSSGLTATLRPDAVGSSTNLVSVPTGTANWQAVDDVTSDGDLTYVRGPSTTVITYDLYNISNLSSTPASIKKVTVYIVVRATTQCQGLCQARTELRTNGVDYHGTTITLSGTAYTIYSTEYINNPSTGQPWTEDEINALQVGVGLKSNRDSNNWRARATQVYAIVEYTDWTNFSGTVDAHLHQYDGSDIFYYYTCANDNSGNENCSALKFDVIDLRGLPPIAPEVYAPVTNYYSGEIVINYTESMSPNEYPISYYNISLFYPNVTFVQTIQANNSISLSYIWNSSEASDGSYRISVEACDNQGQCSSGRSQIFLIDNTKPVVNFTLPTEISGSNLSRNYIYVNVTSIDTNFDRIRILLYNSSQNHIQTASEFSSPAFWNFIDLEDGIYYFNATAFDLAGNSNSTETRNVTIDTTGPVVQFVSSTTSDGYHNQTWIYANVTAVDALSELKNITIYLYNSTENLINSTNSTTSPLQINFTGLAYDTYFINATAYDVLNNSDSSETIAIVLSATPDTTPPASVTYLNSSVVNNTAIAWQWTNPLDEDFDSAILYLNSVNIINTSNNYYNATDLSCNTEYHLTIHTNDYSNNVNTADVTNTNTTSACPDTAPPASVTGLFSNVISSTIISWQWNNPGDADFSSTILYLNGINVADTTNEDYNATGLTCNTQYNLTINTRDTLWNINTVDVTDTATTSACPGTPAVTPSGSSRRGSYIIYRPTQEELNNGYTKIMYQNWEVYFIIENKSHTLKINYIISDAVKISISSEIQEATLLKGEEKKFEMTGDNYYDLLVKLNSIDYSTVNLTIKTIHEEKEKINIPVNEILTNETPTENKTEIEKIEPILKWKLFVAIIVVIFILILLGDNIKKKTLRYRKYSKVRIF
ncbi:MAG: hypothetical protein ABH804_02530 [archaeon]